MSVASASEQVPLAPVRAFELWADTGRWRGFVEGFERVVRIDADWPSAGSEVVWQSVPGGRGRVHERVLASEPGDRFETAVEEERLTGIQTVTFEAVEGGAVAHLSLDYALVGQGPLGWLTDLLFIRRAELRSLGGTLRRFGVEAADEAAL